MDLPFDNPLWLLVLALFALGWYLMNRRSRREPDLSALSRVAPAGAPAAEAKAAGDGELVAVITAAIVAASGLSPADFRIRSIQSTGAPGPGQFNTPPWGHADRFSRPEYHR